MLPHPEVIDFMILPSSWSDHLMIIFARGEVTDKIVKKNLNFLILYFNARLIILFLEMTKDLKANSLIIPYLRMQV
jgi:hypothetical protein